MKKKKLSWSLRWENFICGPRWRLEDWLCDQVSYAIDEELNKNIFLIDENNELLDYFSTTSAGYQIGMIVQTDKRERFLIERIEVNKKCTSWELHGKLI